MYWCWTCQHSQQPASEHRVGGNFPLSHTPCFPISIRDGITSSLPSFLPRISLPLSHLSPFPVRAELLSFAFPLSFLPILSSLSLVHDLRGTCQVQNAGSNVGLGRAGIPGSRQDNRSGEKIDRHDAGQSYGLIFRRGIIGRLPQRNRPWL